MSWRPDASPGVLAHRARLLARVREFFAARNVLEVETPALLPAGVSDPHLRDIPCRLEVAGGQTMWLHTSPESPMKRLLAAGAPDIYQVCRVFRDGELGPLHQPEFTMIEWYRRGFDMERMIDETAALIGTLRQPQGEAATSCRRYRYQEIFLELTGIDPLEPAPAELARQARARLRQPISPGLQQDPGMDRDAWLDLLMSECIMPALPREELVAITHFPASQAALARLDPEDARVAERFELFAGGMELANGYRELRDPAEQRRRLAADAGRRRAAGKPVPPPDAPLLAALDSGLPDCGVAVGFDRVLMLHAGLEHIAQAVSFAHHFTRDT